MRLIIRDDSPSASAYVANYIISRIKAFSPTPSKPFVLGLPTGSSPLGVYRILVEKYKAGEISFTNIVTFNMDEYISLPRDHPQSYHTFMHQHLFSHINIPPQNVHIPDGCAPCLETECASYEAKISSYGGIDLFLCGLGSDGHIAFNEPGSSLSSRARVKTLAYDTVLANARFFGGDVSKVPRMAVTVGVSTVMEAREVVVVVLGAEKAPALQRCVEEGVNHMWTGSALQMHPFSMVVCDEDATAELRVKTVKYFKSIEQVAKEQGFEQGLPVRMGTGVPRTVVTGEDEGEVNGKQTNGELETNGAGPPILAPQPTSRLLSPTPVRPRSTSPDLVPDRMATRIQDGGVFAGRLTPTPENGLPNGFARINAVGA
ncbi:hypothetical protein OQA88_10069 [Cercophora sp. LCS_1]